MPPLLRPLAAAVLVVSMVNAVRAVDPSGGWTWSETVRGVAVEKRLTLILKDGKRVVGSVITTDSRKRSTEDEVRNGVYEYDTVTFQTERDVNGQKVVTKFRGKVLGAHISGTVESPGASGLMIQRDWVARKVY